MIFSSIALILVYYCSLYYLDGIVNFIVLLGFNKLGYGTEEEDVHLTLSSVVHYCRDIYHVEEDETNQQQDLKNVKRYRDGMPKSRQTR